MALLSLNPPNLMQNSLRLLMVVLFAAWTGSPLLAVTKSQEKKTAKPTASAKKRTSSSDSEAPAKKTATADKETSSKKAASDSKDTPAIKPAHGEDDEAAETAPVMKPAAVSTISIEDISGFDEYPKQIQSLVQSSLALTHLELGYLYGSHEPSQGGMDCSGTIYHVLHFQGLKDVPRQSNEMCQWVDKKTQLHLTPTATSFDSEEFKDLKPGDLLFWTNTTATTRKLPVTHVMVYLGKVKKTGKRIVFGSSDGRSYQGNRRSGVSVFDFSLPRAESPSRFYGYGQAPGLLPFVPVPVEIAEASPAPKETFVVNEAVAPKESSKELLVSKIAVTPKESPVVKESLPVKTMPAPKEKELPPAKESLAAKAPVTAKETPVVKTPEAPKEEVRKAVALDTDSPSQSEAKKTAMAEATPKPKATSTAKPKTSATTKKSSTVSSTRRRTPAAPPKSVFQQKVDHTVSSVRRFFQQ